MKNNKADSKIKKTEFTEDDLQDMAFQSELYFEYTSVNGRIDPRIAELNTLQGPKMMENLKNVEFNSISQILPLIRKKTLNIGH